jgi:hypothetical protein
MHSGLFGMYLTKYDGNKRLLLVPKVVRTRSRSRTLKPRGFEVTPSKFGKQYKSCSPSFRLSVVGVSAKVLYFVPAHTA